MLFRTPAVSLLFFIGAIARLHKPQRVFEHECPTGVHIIGVRASAEESGFGAMQGIVDQLKQKIPGSDSFAVDYPATGVTLPLGDAELEYDIVKYSASEAQGYATLKTHIEDYSKLCPKTLSVIMGYSQAS
ncbi:MAG: hypothetical protein Q9208_002366 [Pyrenodesmia sp. 3 TL-2023]